MSICKFCKSEFSNKSALNKHQKRAKYCLDIQKKINEKVSDDLYKCNFCNKKLTSKERIDYHYNICKKNPEIKKLEKNIEKKIEYTNITINNNNTINSITNNYNSITTHITPELINQVFGDFKVSDLLQSSQKNIANIVYSSCLSGKDSAFYICKDRSRHKFVYTDKDNEEKEDPKAILLRKLVYNGLSPIFRKLYKDEMERLRAELCRIERLEITTQYVRDDIKELEDSYKKHNIIKDGEEYISELSKILPTSLKERESQLITYNEEEEEEDLRIFNLRFRKIGRYILVELEKFKKYYKESGIIKGPTEIMNNEKDKEDFIKFLNDQF
jgi:hypothetical protein